MTKSNVVLLILGILIFAAAAYMLLRDKDTSGVAVESPAATAAEQTFLNLTAQIEPVAFDTEVLSDERFMALQDIRTAIIPEPGGRLDPFGPLGGAAAATPTTP